MLCQHCNQRQADTHVKRIVNGRAEEVYLCSECAHELGYETMFDGLGFNLGTFLGNFLGSSSSSPTGLAGVERCPVCGSSYSDIVSSGKVGCGNCYKQFYDKLIGSIQNIHGKVVHTGKIADSANAEFKKTSRLNQLKHDLEKAVQTQNFEKAAQLRDQIKAMEKEGE